MSGFRRMGVDESGWNFGLDKLNRELDRHQFIRELTQNAIEAIQQTVAEPGETPTGDVTWELYPLEINGETVNKLCCIDTGIGMSGEELVDYINTGFRSGKERGHKANFGIGAKVSALTFNKAGVLYLSWKNGEGSMIHLGQSDDNFYGLHRLERPDETFGWWAPIGDERKPHQIRQHGTVVVLMGNTPEEDTFVLPEGSTLPASAWVATYLQEKYLEFPEGVGIRAREQAMLTSAGQHLHNRKIVRIRGQRQLLGMASTNQGVVNLEGISARVHWWLLPPNDARRGGSRIFRARSHVAAIYKSELYEARYGTRGGYQRLGSFGVLVGKSRVVLHVEPDVEKVEANLTRQKLLVDGEEFLWDRYAAAFSDNMPEPIQDMMNEVLEKADSRSNYTKLAERLKELRDMLNPAHRYGLNGDGDTHADTPTAGGDPHETGRDIEDKSPSGGFGGLKSHIDRLIQTATGERAKRKNTKHQTPEVIWVSRKDGTREKGELEDRAAVYNPTQNVITANKDFRNFQRIVRAVKKAVPQSNGAGEAAARFEFETVLVETILNLKGMEGSPEWTAEEVKALFSPEAMTNCVNHSFHIVKAAHEEVRRTMREANKADSR